MMKQTSVPLLLLSLGTGFCEPTLTQAFTFGSACTCTKSKLRSTAFWQESDATLPDIDESFAEQQWYLPSIVERALIHQDVSVDAQQLLQALDMSGKTRQAAVEALSRDDNVQTFPGLLSRDECYTLQNYLWKHIHQQCGIDDVDQCADWQVNLEESDLVRLIGRETVAKLYQVPALLEGKPMEIQRVGIFLRVYERSPMGRPWMPFHSDGNDYTVNVALNNDSEFHGGRLLALTNNSLQILQRQQGDATGHSGSVYHAVSAMNKGTRYSMILFFHTRTESDCH